MIQKSVESIIKDVEETLKTAEFGLNDLINAHPERKLAGLRNLVVFGRAVTNVLQNLRSIEPEFDEWYEKYVKEMKEDPLMKYFYKLRSQILKEGVLKTIPTAHVKKLDFPDDMDKLRKTAPPNAKKFFIGDEYGGSGWEIQLPDGSLEKYYVELPSNIGYVTLRFPKAPKYHLGKKVEDDSIQNLAKLYIEYLRKMVLDAKQKFLK